MALQSGVGHGLDPDAADAGFRTGTEIIRDDIVLHRRARGCGGAVRLDRDRSLFGTGGG